jgi:hypothetical protein
MGADLSLPERQAVRTPMQWTAERHGGVSTADQTTFRWCVRAHSDTIASMSPSSAGILAPY